MMKSAFYIVSCLIFSTLAIAALYVYSNQTKSHRNNFERLFLPFDLLQNKQVLDVQYNGYYIARLTEKQIFLSNYAAPNHLFISGYSLSDTQSVQLKIPDVQLSIADSMKLSGKAVKIAIDSTHVFIVDKITPALIHGILPKPQYTYLDHIAFNEAIALPPSSFIVRTYDFQLQQSILYKVSKNSGSEDRASFMLEKQVDGLFCILGTMLYSPDLDQIIYVYRYRNRFTGLDTTLNLLYHGNTVDMITHAKIKTVKIPFENKIALSQSTPEVNKHCTVYGDRLYIHSGQMADNELKDQFNKNSVIDVYSLRDQEYQFSFYLPDHENKKINDFRVYNDKVVALHDQYLITYNLNTNYFDNKRETFNRELDKK